MIDLGIESCDSVIPAIQDLLLNRRTLEYINRYLERISKLIQSSTPTYKQPPSVS